MQRAAHALLLAAFATSSSISSPATRTPAGGRSSLVPLPRSPIEHRALPDFSLIVLPDTQYYTQQPDDPDNPYYLQAQWIVDNQETLNIPIVLHMGDITHTNVTSEWRIADAAHEILESGAVPYSMVPGNHDYPRSGGFQRDTSLYNSYFGPDRFISEPWYGGHFGGTNDSNYLLFEVGALEFLVLNLEFAPRKEALCWANDVIAAHPERRVIVVTHCYQEHGGGHRLDCADYYDIEGGNGDVIWDEVASRHSNVFLVLSGHVGDSERYLRLSQPGEEVLEILTDYQFEIPCDAHPCDSNCDISGSSLGNGWLRALHFQPKRDRIVVETFSVSAGNPDYFPGGDPELYCAAYDPDPLSDDHAYQLDYDMSGELPPYSYQDGGGFAFHDRTVNTDGSGQQQAPAVALADEGSSVIVWQDDQDDNGYYDIYARGLAAGGCESFADIVVCEDCDHQQTSPRVAADGSGNFVVTWEDDRDDNGLYQIYARGFTAGGIERFAALTVNSVDDGQQRRPDIAMGADGRFVVVWEDDQDNNDYYQIKARMLSALGTELVADFTVNSLEDGQQYRPSVAMDATGGFVVAWEDDSDDNGYFQIYARGFETDGSQRFADFTVNSTATGQQYRPAVAIDPQGAFVVAFEDDQDKDGNFDVRCRGFDATGSERFSDRLVNASVGGEHRAPAIAADAAGAFVIAWEDDQDNNGWWQIWARGFEATGAERFGSFNVNYDDEGQQFAPSLALDADGDFVVAWEDDRDKNDYYEVVARGVDAEGP